MGPTTLTKSRFALALECPRKLDYLRDDCCYDARQNNDFLASLAEGGHQVGEFARQMFPGGILISDKSVDAQARMTAELMALPDVVIFEATIRHENLVIRADVLRRRGKKIELFEVKAKGFDPNKDSFLTEQVALTPAERFRMETELKRYCELDTLAMVMVYQALTGHGLE